MPICNKSCRCKVTCASWSACQLALCSRPGQFAAKLVCVSGCHGTPVIQSTGQLAPFSAQVSLRRPGKVLMTCVRLYFMDSKNQAERWTISASPARQVCASRVMIVTAMGHCAACALSQLPSALLPGKCMSYHHVCGLEHVTSTYCSRMLQPCARMLLLVHHVPRNNSSFRC